jgi:hypothetical protein
MIKNILTTLLWATLALGFTFTMTSCEKDEEVIPLPDVPALTIPGIYELAGYTNNTTTEYSIRSQMSALSTYMKTAEVLGVEITLEELNNKFSNSGNPSLADITDAYYKNLVENSLFPELASSSGNAFDPMNGATATEGGVYGARLFNRRAKETLQEIEKGLFEAAFYNYFINLTQGTIDVAAVDRMVAIYGAHPNFPNTNTAANTSTPDQFIALYAARRDKNDGNGLYTKTRDQFIRLRAAVAAGSAFNEDRDAAIANLKLLIEKSIMATAANYGITGQMKLSSTAPAPLVISGGLHDLGEAVGFIHGFKSVPQQHRRITDAQIDELLELLLAPAGTEGEQYRFVTEPVATLPSIDTYLDIIQDTYGFSDQEMADFEFNWIQVNGR